MKLAPFESPRFAALTMRNELPAKRAVMALAQVAIMFLPATRHSPRARGEGWWPIIRLIGLQGALVVDALLLGLFVPRARRLRLLLGHLAKLNHDLGENVLAKRSVQIPHHSRDHVLVVDRRLVLH